MRISRCASTAVLALLGTAGLAASLARPRAELECESFGAGPKLDCTVRLSKADGTPLKNANVVLGAAMPSMPIAHSVRPVTASATIEPGAYRGTLALEMTGVWAVQIDVAGPARERIVKSLRVECEGDQRCTAAPATRGSGHDASGPKP